MIIIGKFVLGWIFAILSQLQKAQSWFLSHERTDSLNENKKSQPTLAESNASISWIPHLVLYPCSRQVHKQVHPMALVSQPGEQSEHDVAPVQPWAHNAALSSHRFGMRSSCVTGARWWKPLHTQTTCTLLASQIQLYNVVLIYCCHSVCYLRHNWPALKTSTNIERGHVWPMWLGSWCTVYC